MHYEWNIKLILIASYFLSFSGVRTHYIILTVSLVFLLVAGGWILKNGLTVEKWVANKQTLNCHTLILAPLFICLFCLYSSFPALKIVNSCFPFRNLFCFLSRMIDIISPLDVIVSYLNKTNRFLILKKGKTTYTPFAVMSSTALPTWPHTNWSGVSFVPEIQPVFC